MMGNQPSALFTWEQFETYSVSYNTSRPLLGLWIGGLSLLCHNVTTTVPRGVKPWRHLSVKHNYTSHLLWTCGCECEELENYSWACERLRRKQERCCCLWQDKSTYSLIEWHSWWWWWVICTESPSWTSTTAFHMGIPAPTRCKHKLHKGGISWCIYNALHNGWLLLSVLHYV